MSDNHLFEKNNYTTNTFRANNNEHVPPRSKYQGAPVLDNVAPVGGLPRPPDDRYRAFTTAIKQLKEIHGRQDRIYTELAKYQKEFMVVQTEIQSLTFLMYTLMDDKVDTQIVQYIIEEILKPPYYPKDDHYYQIAKDIKELLTM